MKHGNFLPVGAYENIADEKERERESRRTRAVVDTSPTNKRYSKNDRVRACVVCVDVSRRGVSHSFMSGRESWCVAAAGVTRLRKVMRIYRTSGSGWEGKGG